MDLHPPKALEEIAKVLGFGAIKYGRFNWATSGFEYSRLTSAALRHINQFNSGIDNDKESSHLHLAHAACCIMFLIEQHVRQFGIDDRHQWGSSGKTKRTVRSRVLSRSRKKAEVRNKTSKKRTEKKLQRSR